MRWLRRAHPGVRRRLIADGVQLPGESRFFSSAIASCAETEGCDAMMLRRSVSFVPASQSCNDLSELVPRPPPSRGCHAMLGGSSAAVASAASAGRHLGRALLARRRLKNASPFLTTDTLRPTAMPCCETPGWTSCSSSQTSTRRSPRATHPVPRPRRPLRASRPRVPQGLRAAARLADQSATDGVQWWDHAHALMIKYGQPPRLVIPRLVRQSSMAPRPGALKLLRRLALLDVPVLIVSAG